ncbi:Ig-like domain-containing protein [Nostoc sp. FACHB-152]|uniref:Ig-like domain-containing protein n=1 Tax=unclassified Nostoc TaxID=2593658 RepID=UPI001687CF9F|nr:MULTISPECIES: Ig-like domain-containing protein [unclassified Nostoc]MBD2448253.1 Ig-like domain-containing protein [Nostoc sp. FACHB-152]MBD2469274.1 Ig-like domain-containing protein [Nostoc sp. FACHB-145]
MSQRHFKSWTHTLFFALPYIGLSQLVPLQNSAIAVSLEPTLLNSIKKTHTSEFSGKLAQNLNVEIENLDGVPFSDRLVFSRIGSLTNPPSNGVHNIATLRVKNTGTEPFEITGLPITGPWQLATSISLPITIAPGGQLNIPVQFQATSGDIHNGTLTIESNNVQQPSKVVQLSGFWQSESENGQEPNLREILEVFGYTTVITKPGQRLNRQGLLEAVGDEVLSPYWQRADISQPVKVRQLAAYHNQGPTATLYWHNKGSNTLTSIFTHTRADGQTLLPRRAGALAFPAEGTFVPDTTIFGFNLDGEWSDPTKNNQAVDRRNGCLGLCGHHVRVWPVKDRQGLIIPNTWLMTMDYAGINYDYNDNVYLVSNIKPEQSLPGIVQTNNFQLTSSFVPTASNKSTKITPLVKMSGTKLAINAETDTTTQSNDTVTATDEVMSAIDEAVSAFDEVVSATDENNTTTQTNDTVTATDENNTTTQTNTLATATNNRPSIRSTNPTDNQTNVSPKISIAADLNLPNGGIAVNSLSASTVKLIDLSDNTQVEATLNTSAGGDVIVLVPIKPLKSNTQYQLKITEGVQDTNGSAFLPYSISFTTGTLENINSQISFEQIYQLNVPDKPYTTVVIGPDNQLYAATLEGEILRFPISDTGDLGTPQIISSLQTANGGNRSIIGMHFDPSSKDASNLILWVTNNDSLYKIGKAPDWTGKITRLSGPNLETVQDYVVGLPRSVRDHLTNSIEFKANEPDILYVLQGSNTSTGAADTTWGNRPERLLSGAVLRVDLSKIISPPLDVKTEDGGTYNPLAPGALVTIFASGIRNGYDMVWHSNGQLYVPTNGGAAGGNAPSTPIPLPDSCQNRIDKATNGAYTSPSVLDINNIGTQRDYLFRVVQGGYYGHPNPQRCEWVLNGGNPTENADPSQVNEYPIGTLPDRNWKGSAFDFGEHFSPNGTIEYRSNVFSGKLQGKLLVVRYSAGKDIIVLTPGGPNLDIKNFQTGIPGFTGFSPSPLDLIENRNNGYIYVAQLDQNTGTGKITLLRPFNLENTTGDRAD